MSKTSTESRTYYEGVHATSEWQRAGYDEGGGSALRFTKMWYRALIRHVLPVVDWRGKRVLEVGCGNGFLAPHLRNLGATFVGEDIAVSALQKLLRSNSDGDSGAASDGTALPFADRSFDVVICMEVFEHIPNHAALVEECFRVCREAGFVIFSCPNYLNAFGILKLMANSGAKWARRYLNHQIIDRTTTAVSLRHAVEQLGDVVLQRGVRLHPPFFEQLDYRLAPGNRLLKANDALFRLEDAFGDRSPLNYMGLHTIVVSRPKRGAS